MLVAVGVFAYAWAIPPFVPLQEILSSPPCFKAPWYPVQTLLEQPIILHAGLALLGFGSQLCGATMLPICLGQAPYNLSPSLIGVAYLPIGIAGIIGCPLGGKLSDYSAAQDPSKPVRRLWCSTCAALCVMPAALMLYGWSLHFKVHVAVPLAASFFMQMSNTAYLPAVFGYLTQVKQQAAGAASAGIYSLMFVVSGVLVLVAAAAVSKIGLGPLMTALAGLNILCGTVAAMQIRRTCWPAGSSSSIVVNSGSPSAWAAAGVVKDPAAAELC